jgi:nitroreductase/NAD-dependent dihydropyrimidine dehydrogenase PreA subunit
MAIPTTRSREAAVISIDTGKCSGCGKCTIVCKDYSLEIFNGKASASEKEIFGCIGCGHCMAACPSGAISITGRCISTDDLMPLPQPSESAGYQALLKLMQRRRSIRDFDDKPVEDEKIQQILDAAMTAPMGLPPSDVYVKVFQDKRSLRDFTEDYCRLLEKMSWFTSGFFLNLMRPFWGKVNDEMFRGFIKPCFRTYTENMKKGINVVTYDAPSAIYFYGSPYADPADPLIAATYAMLAAETMGLGACMLGAIHPMIQYGSAGKRIRKKYGIRHKSREGIFLIFGYPAVRFRHAIRRSFAEISYHKTNFQN